MTTGRLLSRLVGSKVGGIVLVLTASLAGAEAGADKPPAPVLSTLVVVAGASTPTTADAAVAAAQLGLVPGATSLVDPQRYQRGTTGSLAGFLRLVPGVFATANNGSQDTRLSIRGSGIQSDDILGITILQDGIPINEGDGEVDIEEFDLGNIRYAEVYRGADALRYGATGLGGAINFVSLTGHDVGPLNARVEGGSFGYHLEHVSSGYVSGPVDGLLALGDQGTDGFRDHSHESSQRVVGNLGCRFSPATENRLYVTYARVDRDLPSDLSKDALRDDPRQTSAESIDQDFNRSWTEVRVADRFAVVAGAHAFEVGISAAWRDWQEKGQFTPDEPEGIWLYQSYGLSGDLAYANRSEWLGRANQLTIAMLPGWETEPDHYYENLAGEQGAAIAADRTTATNLVWLAEDRHALGHRWTAVVGAQYIIAHREYEDRFAESATFGERHAQTFHGFNPKVGAVYDLFSKAQVSKAQAFANVSRSFQAPSFDDLVQLGDGTGPLYTYAPLAAQTATTAEVGTRGEWEGGTWDVAIYRSWVRNELLAVNDEFGNDIGTVNVSPTYHQGLEVGLEADLLPEGGEDTQPLHRLVLAQSYTFSDFRYVDDEVYGRNRIAGIPVHFYRAELSYAHAGGFYGAVGMEWNISKYPADQANTLFADPYVLLSARAGYAWSKRTLLFIEGTNLSDRRYASTVAPIADASSLAADDVHIFRPGNGLAVVVGVSAAW